MELRDLITKNIKEVPYEGTEVNIDGIEVLIENLLKGFVTFSHKFEKTNNGYKLNGGYYSKEDIVLAYIRKL